MMVQANLHAKPPSGVRCLVLRVRAAMALCGCTGSSEPSLIAYAVSTNLSLTGLYILYKPTTVNLEIIARILFSRIALKDIFSMLKIATRT